MTANEPAHAEGDDVEGLLGAEACIDVVFEAGGDGFESAAAVARFEAGDVALDAVFFETLLEGFEV